MEILNTLLQSGKIDQETFNALKEEFEKLTSQIKSLEQTSMTFENQIKALEAQISQAKKQGDDELLKELEQTKKELLELKKESVINKLLDRYDLISKDVVFDALMAKAEADETGLKLNGKSIDEGIAEYMENHPELIKAAGVSGSGAGNGGGMYTRNFTEKILARSR